MGEPVSLLGFFISAAGTFGKLIDWLRREDRGTRERVAAYFDQIASCMREVAERIETGSPPRDTCRRLAVYASELQTVLNNRYMTFRGDATLEEARQRLAREIEQTSNIWAQAGAERGERQIYAGIAKATVAQAKAAAENAADPESYGIVESLSNALESEISTPDIRRNVQEIWDAAGEFAALADTLRAK